MYHAIASLSLGYKYGGTVASVLKPKVNYVYLHNIIAFRDV